MPPNNRKHEPNRIYIKEFPFPPGRRMVKDFPMQSETIGAIFLTRPVVGIERRKRRIQAFGILGLSAENCVRRHRNPAPNLKKARRQLLERPLRRRGNPLPANVVFVFQAAILENGFLLLWADG